MAIWEGVKGGTPTPFDPGIPGRNGPLLGPIPPARLMPGRFGRVARLAQPAASFGIVRIQPQRYQSLSGDREVIGFLRRSPHAQDADRVSCQDFIPEPEVSDAGVSALGCGAPVLIGLPAVLFALARCDQLRTSRCRTRLLHHAWHMAPPMLGGHNKGPAGLTSRAFALSVLGTTIPRTHSLSRVFGV